MLQHGLSQWEVYKNTFLGIPVYTVGFALLVVAAVMTIWSMIIYLKAAWPFIIHDPGEANSQE